MDAHLFRLAEDQDRARADAEQLFRSVKQRLIRLLPSGSEIMHVGATAIPGCLTKGDLDVMVRVEPDEFAEADALLVSLYARNDDSARDAGFAAFEDGEVIPHLGVQLVVKDGRHDVFEKFRNRLSESPALLREYNALKRAHDGGPMDDYRAARDRFIARALRY